jgi:hypothetical protein
MVKGASADVNATVIADYEWRQAFLLLVRIKSMMGKNSPMVKANMKVVSQLKFPRP